jgi:hypothetical protein
LYVCVCVCVCVFVFFGVVIIESWLRMTEGGCFGKHTFHLCYKGKLVVNQCMHGWWVRISGNPTDIPTKASTFFLPSLPQGLDPLFTLNILTKVLASLPSSITSMFCWTWTIALDPTFGSFYLIRSRFFGESV